MNREEYKGQNEMDNTSPNPILVTGSHRSGSTWVGNMLALSPTIGYIHEPFNLKSDVCKIKFDYWFTYVCEENESLYLNDLKDCLDFKYHLLNKIKTVRSLKDIGRLLRDKSKFLKNRVLKKRPLVKDPISILSAQWLASRFNMDVVVLIRHPAAFAGSLKKADWKFPFDHLLQQPLLMETHLHEYKSEIQRYANSQKDIVDQAILLWNIIHHMILKYKKNDGGTWIFKKHEELSRNPIKEFGKIYYKLGLDYSDQIQRKIAEFSFADASNRNHLKRNSKINIWSWKSRLTDNEIFRIKEYTHKIASEFYTEEEWMV